MAQCLQKMTKIKPYAQKEKIFLHMKLYQLQILGSQQGLF